jgi:hypothetical protein
MVLILLQIKFHRQTVQKAANQASQTANESSDRAGAWASTAAIPEPCCCHCRLTAQLHGLDGWLAGMLAAGPGASIKSWAPDRKRKLTDHCSTAIGDVCEV